MVGDGTEAASLLLPCDRVAYDDKYKLLALSVAGPGAAIKALRAMLLSEAEPELTYGENGYGDTLFVEGKYQCYAAALGGNTYHLVALSRKDGFLPNVDEETVWEVLRKQTTTPMLRPWCHWIMEQLREEKLLTNVTCVGCEAGFMVLDEAKLDAIVAKGVKARRLKFN